MSKCVIKEKSNNSHNLYKVTYELTSGELLALRHALEAYAKVSPVGSDVYSYTINALASIF